jgi:hypothetical protein
VAMSVRSRLIAALMLAAIGASCLLVLPAPARAASASVTIGTPKNNSTVWANVPVAALCTAGTGRTISSAKYYVDSGTMTDMTGPAGSQSATWSATWNSIGTADGTHNVYVRAYQDNGSYVTASVRVTVNNNSISISIPAATTLSAAVNTTVTTNLAITVKSPLVVWTMTVQKNHNLQSGSTFIPSSRFTFTSSTTGSGVVVTTPTEIPTSPPAAVIGTANPTASSGDIVTVRYALRQTYSDAPATYTATHTFVVTSQ